MGAAMYRKTADGMARVRKGNIKGTSFAKAGKTEYMGASPSGYQKWAAFPDSPFLSETYPYQAIVYSDALSAYFLCGAATPIIGDFSVSPYVIGADTGNAYIGYQYNGSAWGTKYEDVGWLISSPFPITGIEANSPVLNRLDNSVVEFAATTAPNQAGWGRVNI